MSIWSDNAVKDLQEKVAWLEKEIEQLKRDTLDLKGAIVGPSRETGPKSRVNGTR